jgi:hypothetical protein
MLARKLERRAEPFPAMALASCVLICGQEDGVYRALSKRAAIKLSHRIEGKTKVEDELRMDPAVSTPGGCSTDIGSVTRFCVKDSMRSLMAVMVSFVRFVRGHADGPATEQDDKKYK